MHDEEITGNKRWGVQWSTIGEWLESCDPRISEEGETEK